MKRIFEIEFETDNGRLWLNKDNLMMCLTTTTHITNSFLSIKDITGDNCDKSAVIYNPEYKEEK